MMRILAPFSGKFKYNKNYFPDGIYKSPRLILANINWHYSVSSDDEYEYCIKNYDKLVNQDFNLFNPKSDCIVENQPYWSLENSENFKHDYSSENELVDDRCFGNNSTELLAWYQSAHFHKSDDYGIHLIPIGVVHTAEALINNCKNYNLIISRRMAIVWAMNILYCHELVHSWIEDIASLIEFSSGEDIYKKTQKKFHSYIFMEEAICNTAVYGLQLSFLKRDGKKQFETGRKYQAENDDIKYCSDMHSEFNKDKMMKALYDFMKSQPKGYSDFIKIDVNPCKSFEFIRELIYLFKRIYIDKYDYKIVDELHEAMDLYFGLSSHRARHSANIKRDDINFNQNDYYNSINWRDEVPIRFHIT
jgi:hypothetical protein